MPNTDKYGHRTKNVLYIRDIPARVKDLFKAACARRGYDMRAIVIELMKMYLDDPTIIRPRKAFLTDYLPDGVVFNKEVKLEVADDRFKIEPENNP